MKRLFFLYVLLALVGCTHDEIEKLQSSASDEYYATFEGGDSRTYVDSQIRMRWTAEDKITLFKKNTYNRTFMFTGKTGANAGGFKQTSVDDEYWFGYDVPNSYAVYPHSPDNELDESDLFLTVNMPSEQTYAENTFGLNANTMVAVSETSQLIFKNVGSYLRVRLYGNNTAISSVTLTTKGSEAIAGSAKVTPALDGNPSCEMTGNGKSIRLVCPNPVTISEDSNSPTVFWIVVPPVTLASGFTVTVENSEGYTQSYEVDKSFTFERNKYYTLTKEVKITGIPYVTFTAEEEQTFSMSKAVETLQYSVNGGEWTDLGTSTVTFGGSNGELRLRGKSLTGTANSSLDYSTVKFGNSVSVACSGDIRTLVDYENFKTVDTSNARFCCLFEDCSSLTSSPKLSATTLAAYCYWGMFSGCTSLSSAPELPITTLAEDCYSNMFSGCTNLISAPELPATTLAEFCYLKMFSDCTSLTNAPELPATTLVEGCYNRMFWNCSKLNQVTMLATDISARNCLYYWLHGVFSTGTFTKSNTMTSLPSSSSGIPTGWSIVNKY